MQIIDAIIAQSMSVPTKLVLCFYACLFAPKRKRQLAYLSPVTFVECYIQPLFFLARFKLNG